MGKVDEFHGNFDCLLVGVVDGEVSENFGVLDAVALVVRLDF